MSDPIEALAARWRSDAETLRRYGQDGIADATEEHARELLAAWTEWETEALTLREASEESGYSYSRLQHLVSEGALANVGGEGAPRVRRCDLPRHPSGEAAEQSSPLASVIELRRQG